MMFKNNNLYITSNDFSKFSDLIYSDREKLENQSFNQDTEIIDISTDPQFKCITYKQLSFEITSGDIVFCNSNQLDNFFYHLKKYEKIKNLTLITHQTDKLISKKDFEKRPQSISKWYGVNVGHKDPSLLPIPIGIASDFSLKNLNAKDFPEFNKNNYYKDEIKMYVNFKINTNFNERNLLYKQFEGEPWVDIDPPDLNKEIYLNKLKKSSFVLCPWGNGVDTHRFWEALYSGSIPITKKHITYETATDLPVLFVDDYKDINFELLSTFMRNLDVEKYNFEKLTKNYWNETITNTNKNLDHIKIRETKYETNLFRLKRNSLRILNSYKKRYKTFINKVRTKLTS